MNLLELPIEEIKISRERFREATGDMEGLAASLLRFGQLQPVVIDDNNELLAGFRRYTAITMNAGRTILAVRKDDVDELMAREIELEENIQRHAMTWLEEARAIAELDRIKRERDPNWTQTKTAQAAGVLQSNVSEATKIVKMVEMFPELAKAKSFNQAESWAKAKAANVQRVLDVANSPEDFGEIEDKIILGDSVEVIKHVPDEAFHAVITDPPFGINYEDRTANTVGSVTSYEDGEEDYLRLLSMAPDLYRVIKPNGWLVWFLGISWYERAKLAFRGAGFTVDEIPIIWDRSGGRTFTNRPDRYFTRGYDIALHCFKGEPRIVQPGRPNVIRIDPVANEDRVTLVERPIDLYAELIRRLTIPGETVADFFVGGGGCPAAAASLGRNYFGVELSAERRAYAIKKIKANTASKK